MQIFDGFPAGKDELIHIPERFFWDLMPKVDNLVELKVILYCLWCFHRQENEYRYVRLSEALHDEHLLAAVDERPSLQASLVQEGFERATVRQAILTATTEEETYYFPNSRRGRDAIAAITTGVWSPSHGDRALAAVVDEPNIFRLYRAEIGDLTPMIAESLRYAEEDYPYEWIVDAIKIAVERNVRNWKYIERILKKWAKDGRQEFNATNRRSDGSGASKPFDYSKFSER